MGRGDGRAAPPRTGDWIRGGGQHDRQPGAQGGPAEAGQRRVGPPLSAAGGLAAGAAPAAEPGRNDAAAMDRIADPLSGRGGRQGPGCGIRGEPGDRPCAGAGAGNAEEGQPGCRVAPPGAAHDGDGAAGRRDLAHQPRGGGVHPRSGGTAASDRRRAGPRRPLRTRRQHPGGFGEAGPHPETQERVRGRGRGDGGPRRRRPRRPDRAPPGPAAARRRLVDLAVPRRARRRQDPGRGQLAGRPGRGPRPRRAPRPDRPDPARPARGDDRGRQRPPLAPSLDPRHAAEIPGLAPPTRLRQRLPRLRLLGRGSRLPARPPVQRSLGRRVLRLARIGAEGGGRDPGAAPDGPAPAAGPEGRGSGAEGRGGSRFRSGGRDRAVLSLDPRPPTLDPLRPPPPRRHHHAAPHPRPRPPARRGVVRPDPRPHRRQCGPPVPRLPRRPPRPLRRHPPRGAGAGGQDRRARRGAVHGGDDGRGAEGRGSRVEGRGRRSPRAAACAIAVLPLDP